MKLHLLVSLWWVLDPVEVRICEYLSNFTQLVFVGELSHFLSPGSLNSHLDGRTAWVSEEDLVDDYQLILCPVNWEMFGSQWK